MKSVFLNCSSLTKLPDISKWNTNNVKDLSDIFRNCYSLKSIPDISIWNTKNVMNINKIFYKCSSLISLPDISKWNLPLINNKNNIDFYDGNSSTNSNLSIKSSNTNIPSSSSSGVEKNYNKEIFRLNDITRVVSSFNDYNNKTDINQAYYDSFYS